jgi:hypothetical protein
MGDGAAPALAHLLEEEAEGVSVVRVAWLEHAGSDVAEADASSRGPALLEVGALESDDPGRACRHADVIADAEAQARRSGVTEDDRLSSSLDDRTRAGILTGLLLPVLHGLDGLFVEAEIWGADVGRAARAIAAHGATVAWWPEAVVIALARDASSVRDRLRTLRAVHVLPSAKDGFLAPATREAWNRLGLGAALHTWRRDD